MKNALVALYLIGLGVSCYGLYVSAVRERPVAAVIWAVTILSWGVALYFRGRVDAYNHVSGVRRG